MMTIFTNILKFITNPKNTRMILLGVAVVFLLLFLQQCSATKAAKAEVELQKQETQRISNNYEAAADTIRQGKVDEDTWKAEKAGYELTIDEAKEKYADLLKDFKYEKNKPPKVIIETQVEIKEVLGNVKITSTELDSNGNATITASDTARFDSINYRYLNGKIPYKLVFNKVDSTYKIVSDHGVFELRQGIGINYGLFQDKKTKKISVVATTDYPGITFKSLEGSNIMDDDKNKKLIRQMRKSWSLGMNIGYGILVDVKNGGLSTGPYVGVGLTYSPKFLQWGR